MAKSKVQSKTWLIYLILGILVLICGGNFLANPLTTLATISLFSGILFLIVGVASVVTVLIERKESKFWILQLVLYILLIILAVLMMAKFRFTVSFLWLITAVSLIIIAVSAIIKAADIKKKDNKGWIYLIIFGILAGLFGLIVLGNPLFGLNFITAIFAAGIICFGIALIVISFQTKPPKK